jgi:hypothetical protein
MTRAVHEKQNAAAKTLLQSVGVNVLPSVWEFTAAWASRRQKMTPLKLAHRYLLDIAEQLFQPKEAPTP